MIFYVVLFTLHVLETLQHLSYPVNFCNMASTCIHDSHQVCASTPDGCTRRSFLDQCDMYEYNCDYGTLTISTYTIDISTKKNITTSNEVSTAKTDDITHSKISQNTNDFTSLSVETSIKDDSKGNDSNSDDNYEETNETSNWITQEPTEITESITANENTQRRYQICCNRPLTWETTTEITNIITDVQTDIAIKEDSDSSSKENTDYTYELGPSQTLPVVSDITTIPGKNISSTIPDKNISSTIPDKNISSIATTMKPPTKGTDKLLSDLITDHFLTLLTVTKNANAVEIPMPE
ncbi:hypothetical protein KGM_210153 [Danaus plexippus plexippus]|uniref:Uncharacterized protein n=1 Tax=Danaus plexippus plexippus TaxID=278856 RepID=A0A212FGL6_DANPL|nr:hypothetical protein KGM_210153 [Danaus plexippus plexippus]